MIRGLLAVISAVLFLILGIVILPIEWLIAKVSPAAAERSQTKMLQWEAWLLYHICSVKLTVRGLDNIPSDQPVLYIGNHNSIFDCICMFPYFPGRFGYIAKDNLKKVPLLSTWLLRANTLYLNREDPREGMKVILKAIDMVKEGISIFVFPEGTRGESEEMGEFKAGSFKIATKTNCPIIPVTIAGTRDIVSNHIPFVKTSQVIIDIGSPIYLDQLDADEKKHISTYVQGIMLEKKKSLDIEIGR